MMQYAPHFDEVWDEVLAYIKYNSHQREKPILVGHKLFFDLPCFNKNFDKEANLCRTGTLLSRFTIRPKLCGQGTERARQIWINC